MNINKKITAFMLLFLTLVTMCFSVPYGALGLEASAAGERAVLTPGGMAFGVKFFTKGVMVVGIADIETHTGLSRPADDAGIMVGDIITSIDGVDVNNAEEFGKIINLTGDRSVTLNIIRNGTEVSTVLAPVHTSDGTYKTGLWVRDSTAGIGTVTYVNTKTGEFGGLGHGICDSETGNLMPLLRGVVVKVDINGIVKGKINEPGELKGSFSSARYGELDKNTVCGVFGSIDIKCLPLSKPMEIAFKSEVKTGKAFILTALTDQKPVMYEINIVKIYNDNEKTKNFLIKVTDPKLLEKTGGIVQGMSGSPIIQDGRLIGAVTHVMINDPKSGYGIFIENMLEEAAK